MKLEIIVLVSAVLLVVVLAVVYEYRKKTESYPADSSYEKVKNYSSNSWSTLIDLPPGIKDKRIQEDFLAIKSEDNVSTEINTKFRKLDTAYNIHIMDLPPIQKSPRLLPVDQQPKDLYSGMPASIFKTDKNISQFYPEFVPDYLWCKEGVCN